MELTCLKYASSDCYLQMLKTVKYAIAFGNIRQTCIFILLYSVFLFPICFLCLYETTLYINDLRNITGFEEVDYDGCRSLRLSDWNYMGSAYVLRF